MVIGGLLSVIGAVVSSGRRSLAFRGCWRSCFITASRSARLFLVMVHHLTDAGWSVGIRRFCEHLASLLSRLPLILMFLPIGFRAENLFLDDVDPATNNLVAAKLPVFTMPGFYITSAIFFGIWWLLTSRLCSLSLEQDKTGAADCTHKMRFYSGWGIVAFALTLTFSGVLWMKATSYQWFSAIYGVYFFADCAWIGLATVYVIAAILQRQGILTPVLKPQLFLFPRRAAARLHAVLGLHRVRAILRRLERQHAGGNFLVSHPRARQLVGLEHDFDFRPFLHSVFRAAAGEGENEFQNHHSRLPLDLADARAGSGVQHFSGAAFAMASRCICFGCRSAA